MKRSLYYIFIFFSLCFSITALHASQKAMYDLAGPPAYPGMTLSKTTGSSSDRTLLTRAVSEASMIAGGYFTLGTTQGLSSSTLDDKCTITYGHPYAKTSYPLVYVDGTWARAEKTFPAQISVPQLAGDSLTLVMSLSGTIELRFVIRMESSGGGSVIHLTSTLKNTDTRSHTLGLGLVFDPSVGKGGDCTTKLAGVTLARDTVLESSSFAQKTLTLSERSSAVSGLNIGMSFPTSAPSPMIISNWNDASTVDTPSDPQTDTPTLYDALLRIFWPTTSVAAQSSITEEAVVTVMAPNFGNGMFCRWDVPPTQSVENGIPFPSSFTSFVTCSNTGQTTKTNVTVSLSLPPEVTSTPATMTTSVNPQASAFASSSLTIKQLFENKVVTLRAFCKENGIVTDSLVVPFRICSTPLSDTGLVVTIDSIITKFHPKMALTFDVQKKSSNAYVFGLGSDNCFLYENDKRVTDFTLGKDTTGGTGSVDIVFVFDVTGSMSNSIDGVKNNIMEFADSLSKRSIDYRLGMVTFLDAVETVFDFTTSPSVFKAEVTQQYAHGGGDMPENSLDALYRASEMSFRPTAKKVFIWITDANYHENDTYTKRLRQDVIARLLSVDVIVHAIGSTEFQTDWYTPFTQATGGNFYNIQGNFRDILLDIGNLRGTSRYLLSYVSPVPTAASKEIRLSIHYAGYGGTSVVSYALPGKSIAANTASVTCYPNPFNPQTTIRLSIPQDAHASVVIYNVLGQEVRRFMLAGASGTTQFVWNAKNDRGQDVAAGLYVLRATMLSPSDEVMSSDVAKLLYIK